MSAAYSGAASGALVGMTTVVATGFGVGATTVVVAGFGVGAAGVGLTSLTLRPQACRDQLIAAPNASPAFFRKLLRSKRFISSSSSIRDVSVDPRLLRD